MNKKCFIFVTLGIFATTLQAVRFPLFLPKTTFLSSYPYITGSSWRNCCNHVLDPVTSFEPERVMAGDTIFVMINYFEEFFSQYHPRITKPYILISHHFFGESDEDIPGPYYPYLENPKLIAWFTHNTDRIHPKLHPLPIGIADKIYSFGNTKIFDECIEKFRTNTKNRLLYFNFSIHTAPQHRQLVHDILIKKALCEKSSTKPLEEYLADLSLHKFVISPRGNGLDCFRTWEALLLGSFPIVQTSFLDPLFADLPVVIVKDWNDVTKELLEEKYLEFTSKLATYNYEKLYMPYWIREIEKIQTCHRNALR